MVRSSREFEDCGTCFYLSRHVYQRLLEESSQAFLLPEQGGFRMPGFPLLLPRLVFIWLSIFLGVSFSFFFTPLILFLPLFSLASPSIANSLAHSQLSAITFSLILLLLFLSVFHWSPSLPNSLSPFQIPSPMVHQYNPLLRYLVIKAVWLQKPRLLTDRHSAPSPTTRHRVL